MSDPASSVLARRVSFALDWIGDIVSWIWLGLIAVIVGAVVLRYAFGMGRIELEELEWHLYAIGFLFGIVGCANRDRHVRVDVFRERMRPRTRDWVDFYGLLLFQLPLAAFIVWSAWPLVVESFSVGERSASAGGLSFRWLLKGVLPTSFVLLILASVVRFEAVARRLFSEQARSATPAGELDPDSRS